MSIQQYMIKITPEISEMFGIHAGDGYMRFRERNKGEVDISGDFEEKEYYDKHVIPLFNKTFQTTIKGRYFSRGTYGFVTYSIKIRNFLFNAGFPSGKKSGIVKIPKSVLSNKNVKIYSKFMRGLFDTDGCLSFEKKNKKYHYYPKINITTTSNQLYKGACYMLNFLEIDHYVYGYQPKNKRDNYKWVIYVSGFERLEKWMNIIGIKNPSKYSRYLIWKKFGFCPPKTTYEQRKQILSEKLDIYSFYD